MDVPCVINARKEKKDENNKALIFCKEAKMVFHQKIYVNVVKESEKTQGGIHGNTK